MFTIRTPLILVLVAVASAGFAQTDKTDASKSPSAIGSPSAASSAASPSAAKSSKDDKDKLSYAIGIDIGKSLQRLQVDLNQAQLSKGIADYLGSKKLDLSDQELQEIMTAFQQKLAQKQEEMLAQRQQQSKAQAEKNKAEGKKFLDENSKKDGVKTLPSGLQYKVDKPGNGDKPKDGDVVVVNYTGKLIGGKVFDSSSRNGGPVSFPVDQVIKGWSEALKLMPVGSKWQLFLPSELAYDDEGQGEDIQPGSTLLFDVELLSVKKDAAAGASASPQKKGTTGEQ